MTDRDADRDPDAGTPPAASDRPSASDAVSESASESNAADRVVLSYRSPETDPDGRAGWVFGDSGWAREELNGRSYRSYLRRKRAGPVSVGDEWEEFLSTGCGGQTDVTLRVERVEGGSAIGPDTAVESVPRRSIVE